ncbi:MAG TPA: hypothetical protein VF245_12885 [Solirubrobacterales bacterium]
MADYADRLAKMQDEYDEAEAKTSGGSVPDGEYEALIERFDFWEKEGGGPLKLITEISVQEGEFAGMSAPSVWHELEDPDRIAWTKGYLEQLGLEGVNLAELPAALEPLAGKCRVGIRVVTTNKGDKTYRNTYVNEVLEGEGPSTGAAAKSGGDDDIPF